MDPARRTALVSGASSGIGRAFAELLARDGFNVVLVARNAALLAEVAEDLRVRFGAGTLVLPLDLGKPSAAEAVVDSVRESGAFVERRIRLTHRRLRSPTGDAHDL